MAKNGKKPNRWQSMVLQSYNRDPKDWMYVRQGVIGADGYKSLGKDESKITRLMFRHRTTGHEIFLEVEP